MVGHEHGHVFDGGVTDDFSVGGGARSAVLGDADLAEENLRFGDHASGRLDTGNREGGAVWRVRVAAGLGLGLFFHDRQVRHALRSTLEFSSELIAIEIDEADLLGGHEAFRNESRRAKDEAIADAEREVAAIAVGVFARPHAFADVDHALLEHFDRG